MASEDLITTIVTDFYSEAVVDILIGYQFRKIQLYEGYHPLVPPIEAFRHHIPRIVRFWQLQLLGKTHIPPSGRFDLLASHRKLHIKRGELDRWIKLFDQTLEKYDKGDETHLIGAWRIKLQDFRETFIQDKGMIR